MIIRRSRMLFAPLGACVVLTACIAVSATDLRAVGFSLLYYLLANTILFVDGLDFALRLFALRNSHGLVSAESPEAIARLSVDVETSARRASAHVGIRPYAIVVSVFNLEEQLDDFMEALEAFRDRVWVISDGSKDHTVMRLRQAGWRCFDDGVNRHKPGALRKLLERLPAQIETLLVIDPDIRIGDAGRSGHFSLERVIGDFQRSGAAAACPCLRVVRDGFVGRFQALEYAMAFGLGRRSLADYGITSGVSLYRRDSLARALAEHSQSIYAEDLENALILLRQGEAIYYDGRLVIDTEGPGTWRRWFSQRVGWYYGFLKVYVERFSEIRRVSARSLFAAYHYLIYMGFLSLCLHALKMLSVVMLLGCAINGICQILSLPALFTGHWTDPAYFAIAAVNYCVFMLVAMVIVVPRGERGYPAPIVPLYFVYALFHVVPMTVGYCNWLTMRLWGRRVYRDHYESSSGDASDGLVLHR